MGFHVPSSPPLTGGSYKKYAIRGDVDLSIVGAAARLTLDEGHRVQKVRVVLGAVGPTPLRAGRAEEILLGHVPEEKVIEKAARAAAAEAKPISDQRGTAQYRTEMVRVWTHNAIQEAFQKACEPL
jgi:carbon-monoxide dehydrogenase medium subunit